jgi:hypothetical protein
MDTDGHCSPDGNCEITSSYPNLANGIIDLIRSLGIKLTAKIKKTYLYTKYQQNQYFTEFLFL